MYNEFQPVLAGGIWSHSSPTRVHVIFSVSPSGDAVLGERIRALFAFCGVYAIPIKPLIGSYRGRIEWAFITTKEGFAQIEAAGFTAEQESVLYLGSADARDRRKASLVYTATDHIETLGWYGSVTEAEAKASEAWTYDPEQGLYFIARAEWPNPARHVGVGALG
jgi:hypothetical protein